MLIRPRAEAEGLINVPGNQLRLLHEQVCAANSATMQEGYAKAADEFQYRGGFCQKLNTLLSYAIPSD
jgi:hypothetical protein